jgi:blue copper oxidase
MKRFYFPFLAIAISAFWISDKSFSQNPLFIPDTLSGTTFALSIQKGTQVFYTGYNTNTMGYNGSFLGPTLFMNKGDNVNINVKNNLPVEISTVHWHGFHVPAKYDGGPYQTIAPSSTWSPSFKIRNNAATYWYHAHVHGKTEIQVSKGLAGMIIVRDSTEASYNLPRHYKVDDFPLIVQSRIFDFFYQIGTATHEDSVLMVNGTMNAYLQVPKQVVRFRLLNGSADRTYNFGLSDSADFFVIASDGGLLAKPFSTKRLRLSNGERAEILVDFGNDTLGQKIYLKSYASELPRGITGADSVGERGINIQDGYYQNKLNGSDFNVLRFDVIAATASPVTTIPASFAPIDYLSPASANASRSLIFTPDLKTSGPQGLVDGPFFINNKSFHMDTMNIITYLGNTEIWSLINQTYVAHSFHIHDVQFFILDINKKPPPPELSGYKDVVLVEPHDTVRFITQFSDFADKDIPYMYHCHLLHHEDDGMMGAFLVLDSVGNGIVENAALQNNLKVYHDFNNQELTVNILTGKNAASNVYIADVLGRKQKNVFSGMLYQGENELKVNISDLNQGIYFVVYHGEFDLCKKIIR